MADNISKLLERKDVNDKIVESLERTNKNKNEHAFDFCHGDEISTSDIEEGSEYHITLKKGCPIGTKSIGNLHTHVHLSQSNNDAIPSPGDMIETIERDLKFVCVSGNGRGKQMTRCFSGDDIKSEIYTVLNKMKLTPGEYNVKKSSRQITKRMIRDKDYLDKMSQVKII